MEAALTVLSGGVPLYRSGLDPEKRALLRNLFLLTDKSVLAVVNVGEDQLDKIDAVVDPVTDELGGHGEALGVCVQLEAETAQLPLDQRRRASRGPGSRRRGAGAGGPGRVPPARSADVPHHRGQGIARLELPGRRHRPGVRRRHPLRPAEGLHPGRGDPLGRAARVSARGPRPRRPDGSVSKARTTTSPTATSSRSGSTCESGGETVTSTTWRTDDVVAA